MAETIRILIAEDHDLVRRGLNALISTEPGMEIVGEARDGIEAVSLAETLDPDIILLDLIMPEMGGLEAIKLIQNKNSRARILVLTSFSDDDKVFPALKAGALGYLLKDSSPVDLLQAIRHVNQGESSLSPSVALKLVHEIHHPKVDEPVRKGEALTSRELEVLEYLAQGHTNQEIADMLVISERTIRNHVGNILGKLHLANRTQAALYALREGLSKSG